MTSKLSLDTEKIIKTVIISMIIVLFSLSLDKVTFKLIPNWLSPLRYVFVLILIFNPSRTPQFLVPLVTSIIVTIILVIDWISTQLLSISIGTYESLFVKIILNILAISLMIAWTWLSYQFLTSNISKNLILVLTPIIYLITVIAQFFNTTQDTFFTIAIMYTAIWLIYSILKLKPLYQSKRILRGKIIIILGFLSLLLPRFIKLFYQLDQKFTILGFDIWLYSIWFMIFLNTDLLISTKNLTIEAVEKYYPIRLKETEQCIVFRNFDPFLRGIPEKLIYEIDQEPLTMTWIGLQRNN